MAAPRWRRPAASPSVDTPPASPARAASPANASQRRSLLPRAPTTPAVDSSPPETPTPYGPNVADAPSADPAPRADDCPTGVDLLGRLGILRRSLHFYQDVYGRLRTLDTNLYVYRLDGAIYPTFRSLPLDGRVGFIFGYEGAFPSDVRDDDFSASFPVSHSELFGGLRVRAPVRGHVLGFNLAIGRLASGLDDGTASSGTPDVRYQDIRTSFDLALWLGPVRTLWSAGFRLPLEYGELAEAEWFPRVGGYGMEAAISAEYPIADGVALELATSLRRFVLEMNSAPEDGSSGVAEIAGGAVDSFIGLYTGVRVAL
jgi:hypothetical protein